MFSAQCILVSLLKLIYSEAHAFQILFLLEGFVPGLLILLFKSITLLFNFHLICLHPVHFALQNVLLFKACHRTLLVLMESCLQLIKVNFLLFEVFTDFFEFVIKFSQNASTITCAIFEGLSGHAPFALCHEFLVLPHEETSSGLLKFSAVVCEQRFKHSEVCEGLGNLTSLPLLLLNCLHRISPHQIFFGIHVHASHF